MKNFIKNMALVFSFMITAVTLAGAQSDDLYFDPEKDAVSSQEVMYDDVNNGNQNATAARGDNQNNRPDGGNDRYNDYNDYDEYDDYEYYYSSRIKRFHRPYIGFGYFDDCYVNLYNYDPFWTGATIYIGYDSYNDYFRWRRFHSHNYWHHWGPTYTWGWGYNPWGWNNWHSWHSPWTPWGAYAYSACPPYGNIYINNVYYGNNWGHGGWYHHGWKGYYDGGHYNEYTSNVHYGPRKTGSSITRLVDNPRGKSTQAIDNPRGVTNQSPVDNNPGKINRNQGTATQPGQTTVKPDRVTKPEVSQGAQTGPTRIPGKVQDNKAEEQVKFDRRDGGNNQQNTTPATPKDTQKPVRKDTPVQSPVKDDKPAQNPVRNNNPSQGVQNTDEYKFNSSPSRPVDRNNNQGVNNNTQRPGRNEVTAPVERPQRQERVERPQRQERVERPQRQERVERPQRQEQPTSRPSYDQGSRQRMESPAPSRQSQPSSPSRGGSSGNNNSGQSSNPRGR